MRLPSLQTAQGAGHRRRRFWAVLPALNFFPRRPGYGRNRRWTAIVYNRTVKRTAGRSATVKNTRGKWKDRTARNRMRRSGGRSNDLQAKGICYACYDLKTGELFRDQNVVFENPHFRVALDSEPRMRGHTIILYKPHREDVSELTEEEAGRVFAFCVLVTRAIKGCSARIRFTSTRCATGASTTSIFNSSRVTRMTPSAPSASSPPAAPSLTVRTRPAGFERYSSV